jgi:uncharacterized protein
VPRAPQPGTTQYDIRLPRLPAAAGGLRLAVVADLHQSTYGAANSGLLGAVHSARPDLIAVTGDLVDLRRWDEGWLRTLVRGLTAAAPVFACLGNHEAGFGETNEVGRFVGVMEACGARVLRGTSVTFWEERGDIVGGAGGRGRVVLCGLDDPLLQQRGRRLIRPRLEKWKRDLTVLRRGLPADAFTILVSHRPEQLAAYAAAGFDLVLCGHAHGGQVRLPLLGPLFAPEQGLFPRYTAGLHEAGGTMMVVSRGLSRGSWKPRLWNKPEVVVAVLRGGG